jgi:hypothetical protein
MRAQTELPAIGIALLLLTVTLVLGISTAQNALVGAQREPVERQTAVGVSDRLVDARAPLTVRENVLDGNAIEALEMETLVDRYGLPPDADVRVTVAGETVVETGSADGGATVERIVLVAQQNERVIRPQFESTNSVTLPRRSANATVSIRPPANTTVRSVWANDRLLLANDDGLSGVFELSLSPLETTQLRFEAIGPLASEHVRIDYYPLQTSKATLAVTVDG